MRRTGGSLRWRRCCLEGVELQVIDGILYGIEMTVAADKAGAFIRSAWRRSCRCG